MSKKNLFMGGAVLLVVMILALVGCGSPVGGKPDAPGPAVTKVALGEGKLAVTFNDTLANIDKAKGPAYTTTPGSYAVSKTVGGKAADISVTDTPVPGADDKTIILLITGIETGVTTADSIKVTPKGMTSLVYKPAATAPKLASVTAISSTGIRIVFDDGVALGTTAGTQFTFENTSFAAATVTAHASDPRAIVLTAASSDITADKKDITITYKIDGDKKLVGINGKDIDAFEKIPVTVAFDGDTGGGDNPKPLTAEPGADNSATKLVLKFSSALYKDSTTPAAANDDLKTLFLASDKTTPATPPAATDFTITSATLGADLMTVTFALANATDNDILLPAAGGKTVMNSKGEAWTGSFTLTSGKWAVTP